MDFPTENKKKDFHRDFLFIALRVKSQSMHYVGCGRFLSSWIHVCINQIGKRITFHTPKDSPRLLKE